LNANARSRLSTVQQALPDGPSPPQRSAGIGKVRVGRNSALQATTAADTFRTELQSENRALTARLAALETRLARPAIITREQATGPSIEVRAFEHWARGHDAKDANKHAEERQHEVPPKIDSTDKPVIVQSNKDANEFEKAMREERDKLATLRAETAARREFSGSLAEEEAASKRAEVAQNLLNKAQQAGIEINYEVISRIADLADAYSKASSEAIALAKSQQEAEARTKDLESTGKSAMTGFVEDLAHGKTASEALHSALAKIGDKMIELGMDALWKSMIQDAGGHNVFAGVSKLFDREEKPAYAPGSSLGDVTKAAHGIQSTAHMSVQAGTVTVTGAGGIGSDAKFPTSGQPDVPAPLPAHPETPTPGLDPSQYGAMPTMKDFGTPSPAQPGAYVDPWTDGAHAAAAARDQRALRCRGGCLEWGAWRVPRTGRRQIVPGTSEHAGRVP
jgi:hypothetical protein